MADTDFNMMAIALQSSAQRFEGAVQSYIAAQNELEQARALLKQEHKRWTAVLDKLEDQIDQAEK